MIVISASLVLLSAAVYAFVTSQQEATARQVYGQGPQVASGEVQDTKPHILGDVLGGNAKDEDVDGFFSAPPDILNDPRHPSRYNISIHERPRATMNDELWGQVNPDMAVKWEFDRYRRLHDDFNAQQHAEYGIDSLNTKRQMIRPAPEPHPETKMATVSSGNQAIPLF